jgi:dienelactone hydrolase
LLLAFLTLPTAVALGQGHYVEQEVLIPWVKAAPNGLDALLVYADLPGKHPLAVITHGTSRKPEERSQVTAWQELPQALWFARRGWIALVVVRRGYGVSGGEPDTRMGQCPRTDYQGAGEHSAEDLRIAIDYARRLPQVDDTRILALGVSTGGFATVALTAKAPSGLMAAINFAGGRGSRGNHDVCNPGDLVHAYRTFGKRSRTPMLWIYAQNDKYFWPELAQEFEAAFRSQGGQDQLVLAPPIGEDGHSLFRHVTAWSPTVDAFLKAQNLTPLAELLPEIKPPSVTAPAGLSEQELHAFEGYLLLGPHKAFALSEHSFGQSVAQMTVDAARNKALENCKRLARKDDHCKVAFVDDADVGP